MQSGETEGEEMNVREYFEGLINDAIEIEKQDKRFPSEYDLWATADGWECVNRETGEQVEIIVQIV